MKMEKNILPFIELEDIASFNYPVYAHMKEIGGITIYETLEEHTNRCKYYFTNAHFPTGVTDSLFYLAMRLLRPYNVSTMLIKMH